MAGDEGGGGNGRRCEGGGHSGSWRWRWGGSLRGGHIICAPSSSSDGCKLNELRWVCARCVPLWRRVSAVVCMTRVLTSPFATMTRVLTSPFLLYLPIEDQSTLLLLLRISQSSCRGSVNAPAAVESVNSAAAEYQSILILMISQRSCCLSISRFSGAIRHLPKTASRRLTLSIYL